MSSAQFDEPGILTEEPQVPTEALLAKPEPLMLTSAENACGDVSTLTPAITSVIDDASALSVLSAPSEQTVVPELKMLPDAVKIAPFESQSPEPSATTPTTAASIKTLPEATVDTEIVHSTGTSAKVAELVLPEERSTHAISKTAPFEPQSAALAPAVFASKYSVSAPEPTASEPEFSAAVDREHTPEPVTPTLIINQPEHAALADNTVPENPVIGEAKAATAATQLESPSVSREQSNTIQSKPGQVTSTHTSQLSLCVTRTPATSETESPIAAKTEVVPDQAKNPSNLTEAASAEVVSPASVEPPVQAHLNITHPEESVTSALALPDSMAPTDGTTSVPSVPATEPDVSPAVPTASVLSGRPSTSVKGQAFPSSGSPGSTSSSPISSRVGTTSSRKKRKSIFGKLKDMFSKDEKGKS